MKICNYAIAIVNVTLFALFLWMFWMGNYHLPGKLDAEMASDVMLQKYQIVCADLTASMTTMCLLAILVIDIALIYMYRRLQKNMSLAAANEKPPEGKPAKA